MDEAIITTMSPEYFRRIGKRMLESFIRYYPGKIYAYYHDGKPDFNDEKIVWIDLFQKCPDLCRFIKRNAKKEGQHYNRKPITYSYKSFAIADGIISINKKYLTFLGADVIAFRNIPDNFFSQMIGDSFSTYLGRSGYHSETDYIGFNTLAGCIEDFSYEWKKYYTEDTIFNLEYWHDSGIYDDLRKKFTDLKFKNLSPWGIKTDHVFAQSEIGQYMDHLKGPRRKAAGSSSLKDVRGKHDGAGHYK